MEVIEIIEENKVVNEVIDFDFELVNIDFCSFRIKKIVDEQHHFFLILILAKKMEL